MSEKLPLYGCLWEPLTHPLVIEIECIRRGGSWKNKNGTTAGMGLFFHMKKFQQILWPEKEWHRWADKQLEIYLGYRIIGVMGPASSGKSHDAATNVLADYYCFGSSTTVIVSSTEREMLEMRVWGEIKKYHRMAKERHKWLPGNLIESRQRIVTDSKQEAAEGRDFRNGIVGVPCKKGGNWQGLGSYVGIKNKRLRLLADEGQLMPRVYVDAISNLNKNRDFKAMVMGNPKETTDALGVICEPSAEIGGWDAGIDQTPGTKTWPTRFDKGICLQLPGSDCPNMDVPADAPVPYPYLITREAIEADIKFYGRDSLQYTMMDEGRMPRGQGTRRVLSRALCLQFHAFDKVIWKDEKQTRIGFVDAAYRGVGGDRCVWGELDFGKDMNGDLVMELQEMAVIPVVGDSNVTAEDQIADFIRKRCEERMISPENFGFDSTGRGSLMAAIARVWSPHVVPIEFGGKPTERKVSAEIDVPCRDYYSKRVTELWWSVRMVIEANQFRGMTEEVLSEGTMREWKIVSGGKIEIETKEDMKIKSGRSPDNFDALACGVEVARMRGFQIARIGNPRVMSSQSAVYKKLKEQMDRIRSRSALNFAT